MGRQTSGLMRDANKKRDMCDLAQIAYPGASQRNSKEAKAAQKECDEMAAGLRESRVALHQEQQRLEDLDPASMNAEQLGAAESLRWNLIEWATQERAFRSGLLREYLDLLGSEGAELQRLATEDWEAENQRVTEGLKELGFDATDPRQERFPMFHPKVRRLKMEMNAARSSQTLKQARADNEAAIELIDQQLARLRDQLMKV